MAAKIFTTEVPRPAGFYEFEERVFDMCFMEEPILELGTSERLLERWLAGGARREAAIREVEGGREGETMTREDD